MERYNLARVTKKIYDSDCKLFSLNTLKSLLEVKKESTLFSLIKRLVTNGVLKKIEKDKYILKEAGVDDFSLANFIYQPSYISFETALNFYGILSQFPYEITSATSKKTSKKIIEGKIYTYTHLQKSLFWGYEKKDGFLIAFPEKALLDQLYLAAKGTRGVSLDEYDFSLIKWKKFKDFLQKYPATRQFKSIITLLQKYVGR